MCPGEKSHCNMRIATCLLLACTAEALVVAKPGIKPFEAKGLCRSVPPQAALLGPETVSQATWALGTSALLCSIFAVFEGGIVAVKKTVPKYTRPAIDALLGEMATLGFIGLLIENKVLGLQSGGLAVLSEQVLGDASFGFELFEGIHRTLFDAALGYFLACSVLVASVVPALEALFNRVDADRDGTISPAEFRAAQASEAWEASGDSSLRAALIRLEQVSIALPIAPIAPIASTNSFHQ